MEACKSDSNPSWSHLVEPRYAHLLGSNDCPPPAIAAELGNLLSDKVQKLIEKDTQIRGLQRELERLEADCEALRKSTLEYELIRAPIRQLPADVLREIFYYCLPTHRHPVMSFEEPPLLFICICKFWRSTALASPSLWTRLHIPLYLYAMPDNEGSVRSSWARFSTSNSRPNMLVEREIAVETLTARRKLVYGWLSQSGVLPLSISISLLADRFQEHEQLNGESSPRENLLKQMVSTVLSFSARFASLELSMPYAAYRVYFSEIPLKMLLMLRKLKVSFVRGNGVDDLSSYGPVSLTRAPNLQRLSVNARADSTFQNIFPNADNLTHLSVHHSIITSTAVHILRQFKKLRNCTMIISDEASGPYIDTEDEMYLPNLTSLSLTVSMTANWIAEFFKQIYGPFLTRFDFRRYIQRLGRQAAWALSRGEMQPPIGLHHLLERSSKVTTLTIDPTLMEKKDMLLCLQSASQVIHLILGRRFREAKQPDEYPRRIGALGKFGLSHLILPNDEEYENGHVRSYASDGQTVNDVEEILLPKLEVFEGSWWGNKTTDEEVKRFILGRLAKSAERNGVSQLKSVKMVFERVQVVDIAADIEQTVKKAGVEFKLDLRYLLPSPFPDIIEDSDWDRALFGG